VAADATIADTDPEARTNVASLLFPMIPPNEADHTASTRKQPPNGSFQRGRPVVLGVIEASVGRPPLQLMLGVCSKATYYLEPFS
jgi:hypothetical protein